MSNIVHSQENDAGARRPDVLAHVAGNVRHLRAAAGLSQSALADLSGISRRMIVGIESGEANVSLSTLDRLATALGVSFSQIVRSPDASDNRRIESLAWQGQDARSGGILLGTAPAHREAELWTWSLAPGERYPAEADASWSEMLYVVEGVLTVEMAEGLRRVERGDFLIFSSDSPYVFVNRETGVLRFVRNVVF
jgi:transcriptional regulator with XRE-family HTH domain